MIPREFDYRRPASVGDALDELATAPDATVLAGGHSLIPDMKNDGVSPGTVVDIGGLQRLEGIDHGEGVTTIGALTTYADLLADDRLSSRVPVLVEAASKLGDRQIRNRGTVGGNLAYADPGADLPAAAIAADAVLEIQGLEDDREVDAESFFLGERETDVADDELVTAVRVPEQGERASAYLRKTHPASGYALVGVAVTLETDEGTVTDARVAANGALGHATRLERVEESLVDTSGDDAAVAAAAERATDGIDESAFRSDPHASGEFRAHLLSVYVERALSAALERSDPA